MASLKKLINKFGVMAGWNQVKVPLFGRVLEGITEIEYDDEQEMENVYGGGKMPIGQSEGNYAAKASITLFVEEKRAILDSAPPGTRLQDIGPFDIPVVYEYRNKIYKDIIRNCRIKNNGVAVKQNDKTIAFKHELLTSHVDWNSK